MNSSRKAFILQNQRFYRLRSFAMVCVSVMGLGACTPVGAVLGVGATIGAATMDERGLAGSADDLRIRTAMNAAWAGDSEISFTGVSSMVHEGNVILLGTVKTQKNKDAIVKRAKAVSGVHEVYDYIRVDPEAAFTDFVDDDKIIASMRKAIFLDGEVLSLNYNIDASARTLYLQGIAQDMTEKQRVLAHARSISGVRYIVEHIRLKDPEPVVNREAKP